MAIGSPSIGGTVETNAQTVEVSAPAVRDNGDLMRIWVTVSNDVSASVDEAGWNQVTQIFGSAGLDHALALFYKIASAESSSAYTVNIKGGVNEAITANCTSWPGVDNSTPQDATAATLVDQQDVINVSPPDITTVTDGAVVETIIYARGASLGIPTGPGGYTTAGFDSQTNAYQAGVYRTIANATAESPDDWLGFSTSADASLITWALRPAAVGGTVINQLQGSNMGADLFNGTLQ